MLSSRFSKAHRPRPARSRSPSSSGPSRSSSRRWTTRTAASSAGRSATSSSSGVLAVGALVGIVHDRGHHGRRLRERGGPRPVRGRHRAPRRHLARGDEPAERRGREEAPRRPAASGPSSSTLGPNGDVEQDELRIVTVPKQRAHGRPPRASRTRCARIAAEDARARKVVDHRPALRRGRAAEAPIMIHVPRRRRTTTLAPLAEQVGRRARRASPGVTDVQVKYTPGRPELRVDDRPAARRRPGPRRRAGRDGAAHRDRGRGGRQDAAGQGRGAHPRAPPRATTAPAPTTSRASRSDRRRARSRSPTSRTSRAARARR